jgi:hypothetical protein
MDIQWVIFAQSYKLNEDKTLDIGKISHHANIVGKYNKFPAILIAKPIYSPIEAGENKKVTIELTHDKNGYIFSKDIPHKIPDLYTWESTITYIILKFEPLELPYPGGYTFSVYVNGEYKNRESIEVTDLLEETNEKF